MTTVRCKATWEFSSRCVRRLSAEDPSRRRRTSSVALTISGGQNLAIKLEYARRYARMMFDQELHDRLLNEVLAAPAAVSGLTLFNTLAKQEAAELLATSTDYF